MARKGVRFGEGTRIVFWIDRSQQILQRGRQESIPIDSIDGFGVDPEGRRLFCRMGPNEMILFDSEEPDRDNLQAAAYELANFCGVPLL